MALDRPGEAATELEEVVEARRRVSGPTHQDTLGSMQILARAYAALARHDDAVALLREVAAVAPAVFGPDATDTRRVNERLEAALRARAARSTDR